MSTENTVDFIQFAKELSNWADKIFGDPTIRGPLPVLKHLQLEIKDELINGDIYDCMEYAVCLMLILDAARRAGHDAEQLLIVSQAKLSINKSRKWPKLDTINPNSIVEHIKG
jgi:hypothetical protein